MGREWVADRITRWIQSVKICKTFFWWSKIYFFEKSKIYRERNTITWLGFARISITPTELRDFFKTKKFRDLNQIWTRLVYTAALVRSENSKIWIFPEFHQLQPAVTSRSVGRFECPDQHLKGGDPIRSFPSIFRRFVTAGGISRSHFDS